MKTIILLVLFIGIAFPYIVSIDSCAKYGLDGRQCKQCITGFQLLNKSCYPKVRGCTEYDGDGSCTKCEPKSFLAGNRCCDGACFEKLIKKSPETSQKYPIEENYQKISKLIEIAENQLPDNVLAQLIWIDIKELNGVERWFLLYRIQNLNSHYQRIVLDYNIKSKSLQNAVVDSSFARIPDEFNIVQWKDVENTQAVLKIFPGLYAGVSYKELSIKIAVLSEVKQFEIVAISEDIVSIRVLYQAGSQIVVLKETVRQVRPSSNPEIPKKTPAAPTAPSTPTNSKTSETTKSSQPIITVDKDGCTTHTMYQAPFTGEMLEMIERLNQAKNSEDLKKKNVNIKSTTTPLIGIELDGLVRRVIATQPCGNSIIREVSVVRKASTLYTEHFDYYLQKLSPEDYSTVLEQVYVGSKNKVQTADAFLYPQKYPIVTIDPSFLSYPNANYYFQNAVRQAYQSKLTPEQVKQIMFVTDDPRSEVDRNMDGAIRFSIDGVNRDGKKYRKYGFKVPEEWQVSIEPTVETLVHYSAFCRLAPQMQIVESFIIGDSGNGKANDHPNKGTTNQNSDERKITYTGVDIQAELDVNEPLIAAVELLKTILPNWDYTLKTVQEEAESADIVEFTIVAQNSTGLVKAKVAYSRSSAKANLVELSQKGLEAEKPAESQKDTEKSTKTNGPQPKQSTVNLISQPPKVTVEEDGCSTHTTISGQLSAENKALVDKLLSLREKTPSQPTSDHQTPTIGAGVSDFIGIGKTFRRLVITQVCGAGPKQYAYVETENYTTTRQYFSYYVEFDDPVTGDKLLMYAGTKNKTQSSSVYLNPSGFPIEFVDPSFVKYPYAAMYYEKGMIDMFRSYLIAADAAKTIGLKADATTERDRQMVNARRFSILGSDGSSTMKMTGIIPPPSFKWDFGYQQSMLVSLCENSNAEIQSYIIGSSGPSQNQANTASQGGNLSVGV